MISRYGKPYRLIWFGDSHTVGAELARHHGPRDDLYEISPHYRDFDDRPDLAFTSIISNKLKLPYKIFGKGSTSIGFALHELLGYLHKEHVDPEFDTHSTCAILSTTGFQREMKIKQRHKVVHISPDESDTFGLTGAHFQVALFQQLCINYKIFPVILPLWHQWQPIPDDYEPDTKMPEVDTSFLLNQGMQYFTLKRPGVIRFDQEILEDDGDLRSKYIDPGIIHPNIAGHEFLADKILPDLCQMIDFTDK